MNEQLTLSHPPGVLSHLQGWLKQPERLLLSERVTSGELLRLEALPLPLPRRCEGDSGVGGSSRERKGGCGARLVVSVGGREGRVGLTST